MLKIEDILFELNNTVEDLDYNLQDNDLELKAKEENGFSIEILFHPKESFIIYGKGGAHDHFNHSVRSFEELILDLVDSLIGRTRIIEYSWDDKPKRFHFQTINDNGTWNTIHKLNFPKWKFWLNKKDIQERILINNYKLKQNTTNIN